MSTRFPGICEAYWGSHGCHLPPGHPWWRRHACGCCGCHGDDVRVVDKVGGTLFGWVPGLRLRIDVRRTRRRAANGR